MAGSDLPTFPEFVWNECFWTTSARLPAWSGYQIRTGPYGSVSAEGMSDGTIRIVFAPEGRDDAPLTDGEVGLVSWLIENEAAVHDAMLNRLFREYPAIRKEAREWYENDEAKEVLPEVQHPEDLKRLVGISFINVHQVAKDGVPFIGIELGCDWDEEHGVGVLLHGSKPLEVGGADTAILLWIAEQYVDAP